jgi:hypothetical protein
MPIRSFLSRHAILITIIVILAIIAAVFVWGDRARAEAQQSASDY